MNSINLVLDKINERESDYEQTWKIIPVADLIAQARIKTFRATAMLNKNNKEKLLDDLIDGATYLLFAIERILCDEPNDKKQIEQSVEETEDNSHIPIPRQRLAKETKKKLNWIKLDHFYYAICDGVIYIKVLKDGRQVRSRVLDYSTVKRLYELLPERATVDDVLKTAQKIQLNIGDSDTSYLMRIFASYVDFDAELVKEGKKRVLIKNNYSLADEIKKQREIENSVIGTPYSVGN